MIKKKVCSRLTMQVHKFTGLPLALSKKLAKTFMGGSLWSMGDHIQSVLASGGEMHPVYYQDCPECARDLVEFNVRGPKGCYQFRRSDIPS